MVIRKPGNIAESFSRLRQLLMPSKWHLVYLEGSSKPVWSDAFLAASDVPEWFSIEVLYILWKPVFYTYGSSLFLFRACPCLSLSSPHFRLWGLLSFMDSWVVFGVDWLIVEFCYTNRSLLAGSLLRPFSTSMLCLFPITAQRELFQALRLSLVPLSL